MGLFGRQADRDEAPVGPPPAVCASAATYLEAPLRDAAAAAFVVGFAGRSVQDDPHSVSAVVLTLAKLIAAQPDEERGQNALVPLLMPYVEDAVHALERSLLVRPARHGAGTDALVLTRRGAQALAAPDPAVWVDVPADPV